MRPSDPPEGHSEHQRRRNFAHDRRGHRPSSTAVWRGPSIMMVREASTAGRRSGSVARRPISAGRAGRTGPGSVHSALVRARAPRPARVRAARNPPRRPLELSPRLARLGRSRPRRVRLVRRSETRKARRGRAPAPPSGRTRGRTTRNHAPGPSHAGLARASAAGALDPRGARVRPRPRRCGDRRSSFRKRHPAAPGLTKTRVPAVRATWTAARIRRPRPARLAGRGRGSPLRTLPSQSRHRSRRRPPGRAAARRSARPGSHPEDRAIRTSETDDDDLLKWILLAYPDRVVKRRGLKGTGVMVGGRGVCLAPDSVVRDADLFVAIDARDFRRPACSRHESIWRARSDWNGSRNCFPITFGASSRLATTNHDAASSQPTSSGITTSFFEKTSRRLRTAEPWRLAPRRGTSGTGGRPLPEESSRPHCGSRESNSCAAPCRSSTGRISTTRCSRELLEAVCQGKSRLDEIERTDLVPFLQSRLTPEPDPRTARKRAPGALSAQRATDAAGL